MEIKRLLFVLCALIIGRVAEQNGTTLDPPALPPNPHTLEGGLGVGVGEGGYLCNGIKWLDA